MARSWLDQCDALAVEQAAKGARKNWGVLCSMPSNHLVWSLGISISPTYLRQRWIEANLRSRLVNGRNKQRRSPAMRRTAEGMSVAVSSTLVRWRRHQGKVVE